MEAQELSHLFNQAKWPSTSSFHKQPLEGNIIKLYNQNVKLFFWLDKIWRKYDDSVIQSNRNAINQNVLPGGQQHGVRDKQSPSTSYYPFILQVLCLI